MRFGILGATEAWGSDGASLVLGGPGRRAALALLALDAGRIVTVQRMVDGLYGENPPAGVGNALQSQISRLRGVLRKAGQDDRLIENHPAGYRLAVHRDQVDVHRFTRLAGLGREALAAGDRDGAASLLRDALALWRGPALADVGGAPFAGPQVVRLEEQRLAATEDRVQAELELGGHREVISELRDLVAAHPLRERLTTQLVRALHGSGQQAEALAAYAQAREALADALGADPGPELAAAHLAVLRGQPDEYALAGGARTRGSVAAGGALSAGNVPRETFGGAPGTSGQGAGSGSGQPTARHLALPAQLNSLVGREPESARIGALLRDGRLLTLTGPGGAGKTRIAVETAARHAGDSCFADLSAVTDGGDLPQVVLSALGLRGSGLLSTSDEPVPLDRLTAALTDRSLLLVLDNCEHLIEAAARLTGHLLAHCPDLRVLATSREALGITGERLLPLPPLPETAAVQLFAERATAVRPGFDPAQDPGTVIEICRRLDGLPLAIELAAARLRMLSPRQIADRLDDRFRLLTGGSRTAQPRQQTLRAVVDWSWDLLPQAERAVLRRASVFSGGWSLAAAEAVCAAGDGVDPADVLELTGSLVDKCLVIAQLPEDAAGETRYRMLQTVRVYAAERLADSGEEQGVQQAHLAYFRDLAEAARPWLLSADQLDWLRRLATDHDNLHTALRRAGAADALRMISALSCYWLLHGLRFEGAAPARRLLEALGPHPLPGLEEEYAICLMLAVHTPGWRETLAPHLAVGQELMNEFRRTPRRNPVLILLWAPFSGVPHELETLTPDEEAQWLADPWHRGLIHLGEGFRHLYLTADAAAADQEFTAGYEAFREVGDRCGMIITLGELSSIAEWHGDLSRSESLSSEALRLAGELGAAEDMGDILCQRAERRIRSGEFGAAAADCDEALALYRRAGSPQSIPRPRLCLATIARLRGDLDAAREIYLDVLTTTSPGWYGGDWMRLSVLVGLGRTAVAAGDADTARAHFRAGLPQGMDTRNLPALADAATAVAGLALLEGEPERAARLLGLSHALLRRIADRDPERAATAAATRSALGDEVYDSTLAQGAAVPPELAIAELTAEAQRDGGAA